MQSSSTKKTINTQEIKRFDLPFQSKPEESKRIIKQYLTNNPRARLISAGDGKTTSYLYPKDFKYKVDASTYRPRYQFLKGLYKKPPFLKIELEHWRYSVGFELVIIIIPQY